MEKSNILIELYKFLDSNTILTLATTRKDKPYISNLFYVADNDLSLYFLSNKKTRHAQEFIANPNVAVSIYDPASAPGKFVAGIQIEGKVVVAKGLDLVRNFPKYLKLFPATKINLEMLKQVNSDTRLFKFTPDKEYFTDKRIFEKREEIDL
jgi:uncharacterized protein YhbP (UPF0306 family)